MARKIIKGNMEKTSWGNFREQIHGRIALKIPLKNQRNQQKPK